MKNRTTTIAANHPALAALANEDLLDLSRNGLDDFTAETRIDYIDRMLRINNGPVVGIKNPDEIGLQDGEVAADEYTRIFNNLMRIMQESPIMLRPYRYVMGLTRHQERLSSYTTRFY